MSKLKENSKQPFEELMYEYHNSYDWLHTFITDPHGLRYALEKSPEERHLEYVNQITRTKTFLDFAGNPQDNFKSVHVAGTGGKGSTSIMIGALLEGVANKVGVHTSPYLQVPGEKYLINRKIMSPSQYVDTARQLQKLYQQFKTINPQVDLKYQEMQVAFADLYFGNSHLDWGVMETGMGGRYDPTNILSSEIAVITNIDFDHVPQLGTTIAEIAFHKAGIIKPGKPSVTGEIKAEALNVIKNEAKEKGSKLYIRNTDYSWEIIKKDHEGTVINMQAPHDLYKNIKIPLLGEFQVENAALAIATANILSHLHGFKMTSEDIIKQFQEVSFPGRMEIIQNTPTVVLDGAHNPQKMAGLARSMSELYPDKKYTLICGMLGTKDSKGSLQHILPNSSSVIACKPNVDGKPAVSAIDLKNMVEELGYKGEVVAIPSVTDAIEHVVANSRTDDLIVITGSLYMLGEARNYWENPIDILKKAEESIQWK